MTGSDDLFDYVPPSKANSKRSKGKPQPTKNAISPPLRYPVFRPHLAPTMGLAACLSVAMLWVGLGTELTGVGPFSFADSSGPITGALTFLGLVGCGLWFAVSAFNAGRCNFGSYRDRQAIKHCSGKWRAYLYRTCITAASCCAVIAAVFMCAHCFPNARTISQKVADNVFRVPDITKTEPTESALPPVVKAESYGPPAPLGPQIETGSLSEKPKPKTRRDRPEKKAAKVPAPVKEVDSLTVTAGKIRAWFQETFAGSADDKKPSQKKG